MSLIQVTEDRITESVRLFYREGTSDKIYNIWKTWQYIDLVSEGLTTQWSVRYAYGRRGNTLATGAKALNTTHENAKRIFDRQVAEKLRKGYRYMPDTGEPPENIKTVDSRDTEYKPQLLNEIDEDQVKFFIKDNRYCMQEKYDGVRRGIIKDENGITGTNKKGQSIVLCDAIIEELKTFTATKFILDGEDVNAVLWIFDILNYNGIDITQTAYATRNKIILDNFNCKKLKYIKIVDTAFMEKEKNTMLKRIKNAGGEGVVFKEITSPYRPGRPASGGTQFKFKFVKTLSAIVVKQNSGKRSVALELMDDEEGRHKIGNVTIPPNKEIPTSGKIVEVRYLYANKFEDKGYESGILYQPVYLGERNDTDINECNLSQLKYKPVKWIVKGR